MAEAILNLSILLILLSIGIGLIRLVKGNTVLDRVIALDLLTLVSMALIIIIAHINNRFIYIDVALVYGLLSFLGVLAVARYLEKRL
ncbi:MAG: cation:proton antiporter [Methylococcales bacterium]|jgi:multicomponent Na+:H+ antiporter subunit F|nr:cation:proton antiporter [Methylococcales bacterium]MBT7445022.1 cation:proton antiporter [Methylococcales bacterium]